MKKKVVKKETKKMGRPPSDKDLMFQKLEPLLKIGCSVNQAASQAEIPKSTVYLAMQKDENFMEKIRAAMKHPLILAQSIVYKKIKEEDIYTAKWLLERRDRKRYGMNLDVKSDVKVTGEVKISDMKDLLGESVREANEKDT